MDQQGATPGPLKDQPTIPRRPRYAVGASSDRGELTRRALPAS
jgi:hypothetical protein